MEQTQIESFKMVEQYDGKNASVSLEINKCPTHMTIMDRLKQDFPLKRERKTKKSIKKNNIKNKSIKKNNIKRKSIKKNNIKNKSIKKNNIKKTKTKNPKIKKTKIKKTKTKIKKIKLQLLTDEDENKKLNNKIYTPLPKNLTIKI